MKNNKAMKPPKLFISYSRSNLTHQQWVIELAEQLSNSGVDVILDKWSLKEGNDAVAFMEKMVKDPEISKVIMICDKVYASKADDRSGGVGTETQIISSKVYEEQEQNKFVAVVIEKDEHGKPYVPIYYKSRIHIDLSEPDNYGENFDQLLRWVYDKPLYKKPEIGKRPAFLDESAEISLGTTAIFHRVVSAIKGNKPFAPATLDEYLTTFSKNLEKFRITEKGDVFDDQVVESIEKFIPYRNEIISLFVKIAQHMPTEEIITNVHRFFESLIPYMSRPENVSRYSEGDFDNFKFIVHELFLCLIAILIKNERFSEVNMLLTREYYVGGQLNYNNNEVMVGYGVFRNYIISLEHRKNRLKLGRLSLHADLLKQRSEGSGIDFRYLMQADFVLYVRATIQQSDYLRWFPETLLYLGHFYTAFEIFARSSSKSYFDKVKCILNIDKLSDIGELIESYHSGKRQLPTWQGNSFSPPVLLGHDQLATKP